MLGSAWGITLLALGVWKIQEAGLRTQVVCDLKQLALAMHSYHDAYGRLPPAVVYGKDGKRSV
jgi:hypothetical protein